MEKTIRDTSIQVYHDIRESGLLGELQLAVYEVIAKFGPISEGELWKEHFPDKQRTSTSPRFAELHRRGAIEMAGKRTCRFTGRTVYVWKITGDMPKKEPRRVKCPLCSGKGYTVENAEKQLDLRLF